MDRRAFIKSSAGLLPLGAIGIGLAPALAGAANGSGGKPVDPLFAELVRANDRRVASQLARQERRRDHPAHGGVANAHGIFTAQDTAGLVTTLVCAGCAGDSAHFHSPELVKPLELAVAWLRSAQHEDGTIDLFSTNFHSPPDTAFILEHLCAVAVILRNHPWSALNRVREDLDEFIVRAGDALVTGGVHTPNHRWVVCGALARVNALYPDVKYVARVDDWLAEGIDLDPDGQYTEKSTTVYSPVVDRALLTAARLLDRPALREPVRRNLRMTLYYVHPDGEVVTEASKRQDKYQRGSMSRYYYSYRTLALIDNDGVFAAMARWIERTAPAQLVGDLPAFLEEPELRRPMPRDATLPTNYEKLFRYSHLARIRREAVSATILAQNTTLLSLRRGSAALEAVRLASAFFGKGQFIGDEIEAAAGRYRMRQHLEGPYFQPLPADQVVPGAPVRMAPNGTLAMDGSPARDKSNIQILDTVVTAAESDGKLSLEIDITGTEGVPVAIELAFRHGGTLHGVDPVADVKDAFLLADGVGRYVMGDDVITFGPGRAGHTWTQLRGAVPKWDGLSVYLTGFTPFRATLDLT